MKAIVFKYAEMLKAITIHGETKLSRSMLPSENQAHTKEHLAVEIG